MRLGDVEQADRQAGQRSRLVESLTLGDRALAGRIEDRRALMAAQYVTARVTGFEPTSPLAQPPMISENCPGPLPV